MTSQSAKAVAAAAVVTIGAWIVTLKNSWAMTQTMPMPGGWTMSMTWMNMGQPTVQHAAMFLAMWTVMMVAMMLPSTMPVVLLHARVIATRLSRSEPAGGSQVLLLLGYFAVWAGFGVVAYLVGTVISRAAMRDEDISRLVPAATGVALGVAGIYQLTSIKRACLQHCRTPLHFFSQHRLQRTFDSFRFGLSHGAYCAACCWGLMVIQLALGVMSVPLMAAVAIVIFIEKHWTYGESFAVFVGIVSVGAGALLVFRAASGI